MPKVTNSGPLQNVRSEANAPMLRCWDTHSNTSSTGVFEPACLFCNDAWKWSKCIFETLSSLQKKNQSAGKIVKAAFKLNNATLLAKISGHDLIANHSCKSVYWKRGQRSNATPKDVTSCIYNSQADNETFENVNKSCKTETGGWLWTYTVNNPVW